VSENIPRQLDNSMLPNSIRINWVQMAKYVQYTLLETKEEASEYLGSQVASVKTWAKKVF